MHKGSYLSLKWKIAILIGSVFLFLHSVFSYIQFLDANEEFLIARDNIQVRNTNIARALIKDSFSELGQFAELSYEIRRSDQKDISPVLQVTSTLDDNWQQWQFIWGLESAVFYSREGTLVKKWGDWLRPSAASIATVLNTEMPDYQIVCPESCFQFVFIPVMADAEVIGVLGVSRTFADTVIDFNRVTGSDIGVLIPAEQTNRFRWPYKISAITHGNINLPVLESITESYQFEDFFEQRKVISFKSQSLELNIFSVNSVEERAPPYFLIINNVTDELKAVSANLRTIWFLGIISLLCSLILMLVVLYFSLRRVTRLSKALPLLAEQKYDEFNQLLSDQKNAILGGDEIDRLAETAVSLSDRLRGLEQEVKTNICRLVDQGRELAHERDFVRQLINVAPIIVITQDVNGIILTVNQAGVDEFSMQAGAIIGGVFDNYIPDTEEKHLSRLRQLRSAENPHYFKIDGMLSVQSFQKLHISWIHSRVNHQFNNKDVVILTLGVDITERKRIEQQMMKMATLDHLTGMSNRHSFQIEIAREIATAKRYGSDLALFYLDLDQFKLINDNSGHEAGDQLLKLVSKTLECSVRNTDFLSRIGGDEFTLIMPKADKKGIENVAKKINENLMAIDFRVGNKVYKISASIGIAIYPYHGVDEHELLSNADLAMYQAKDSGRGQYHLFSEDKDYKSSLTRRVYWKNTIEEALKKDLFILLYQPIMDMHTSLVCHYECLVRIKAEDGSYLMPGDFIPVAEELGLIGLIDRMVIKKAVEQHIKLRKQNKYIKLAVNLSGRSFNDNTIFEDLKVLLNSPEVDTKQLIFEITETSAVSNFASAQALIRKIKGLGCTLALDDFGVGFSSFFYLKHLPVDYVKIDGSFIRNLDKNFEDKVFVKALTEVSQSLGKKTIAEFVENEAILEVLKEFGIDYAQGYHIGKPGLMRDE